MLLGWIAVSSISEENLIVIVLVTENIMVQVKIIGSYGGRARQDLPKLVKLAESGIFNLSAAVSRTCRIEDANEIYQDLNRGSIIGRAVVEIM